MAIPDIEDVAMVGLSKLETLRSIIDGWSHIINIFKKNTTLFVNGNHYVALLPKTDEVTQNARYTYCCHFLRDEDIDAFEGRAEENIPTNEVPSTFGGRLNIVSR
jgi:hypothetical protein